jgi:nicotinamide mononucleotide transporter
VEKSFEIFTLITGVIYIILEIRQKNFMWVVGILTSLAAMYVFFCQGLYASFGLNTYYLVTSFIGLWHWRRDKEILQAESEESVHLNRITPSAVWAGVIAAIAGILALTIGMEQLAKAGLQENPMSLLDAAATMLSVVATWWLVRSYILHWWLWIIADALSTTLCLSLGMWWMAALYGAYTASALIGYRHWRLNGVYVNDRK